MKIYVANLAAYNNGHLIGDWVDVEGITDKEELLELIEQAIQWEGHPREDNEEWDIHDYDNMPNGLTDLDDIISYNEGVSQVHDEDAWRCYCVYTGVWDDISGFEDSYCGEYSTRQGFAQELIEDNIDISTIPDLLQYHIDWEGVARDLFINDYWEDEAANGNIHVFRHI